MSPVTFSNIVKFRAKFEVLLQNNFGQSLPLKSLDIRLFFRKLNSRNQGNSLSVFHRNSRKYCNDQRGKLDLNKSNFKARETQDSSPLQSSKLSQLQNTQLNLLTVTFLAI